MLQGRLSRFTWCLLLMGALAGCPAPDDGKGVPATQDLAREWNHLMLEAQRNSPPAPTIFARTLWHVSAAMYDAWAAYDPVAGGYFTGHRLKRPEGERTLANRAEAISHAVYPILQKRFAHLGNLPEDSPGFQAYQAFTSKMRLHGYLDAEGRVTPSPAQALGVQVAAIALTFAASDGANEGGGYADTSGYTPANGPLVVLESGTNAVEFPDMWQPLILPSGAQQFFLTPHWGGVKNFALADELGESGRDPGASRFPHLDPGPPPFWDNVTGDEFADQFLEVLSFSQALDPFNGPGTELVDLSPAYFGNNPLGTRDGRGHGTNPYTGQIYAQNVAHAGDYWRTIAEYWADGPASETPPGHWNAIANDLMAGQGVVESSPGNRNPANGLAYDVKLYFALNAALHDAAILAWDLKRHYDFVRPISGLRFLAEAGEMPIVPGLCEVIQPGDPLAGAQGEFVGRIKALAWLGPDQGVDWMYCEDWIPYQASGFVTPAFPGYTSGHSTFSRAAAEVLTRYTGDRYFPGGIARYPSNALRFEGNLRRPVELQWATYYDASDEAGLSRLAGGIHIAADDFAGRISGAKVGLRAFEKAQDYFNGFGVAVAKHLLPASISQKP